MLRGLKAPPTHATVKARTQQTKGAGSRQAGLALAFKLILNAQTHWRKGHALQLVALVRAGVQVTAPAHLTDQRLVNALGDHAA